jgi:hypothetical protein
MRTELEDELQAHQAKKEACKESHFEWMKSHEYLYTHALTLTFNPSKINAYTSQFSASVSMSSPRMILEYKDSMRRFIRYMNKEVYGCSGVKHQRLVMVPVIEGLFGGKVPHYHCCLGIDKDKFDGIEASVKSAWSKVPFAGYEIKVEPYRDSGWLTYINKFSHNPNQLTVDWDNTNLGVKS